MHRKPIHISQSADNGGQYKKENKTGQLQSNQFGRKSAGHEYIEAPFSHLKAHAYRQSDTVTCLFATSASQGHVLLASTVDNFPIIATNRQYVDYFQRVLHTKYKFKRLEEQRQLLEWFLSFGKDGNIKRRQPALVDTTIANPNMQDANGRHTPYPLAHLLMRLKMIINPYLRPQTPIGN